MNLLFIEGMSPCCFDTEGNAYLGSDLQRVAQQRYKNVCDHLTILTKTNGTVYPASEIPSGYYPLDKNIADLVTVPNIYRPRSNFLSLKVRRQIHEIMSEAIQKADAVLMRIALNYNADVAEQLCRKFHKTYCIQSVDCVFEHYWNYGIEGKIIAPFYEWKLRRMMRRAPYVLYVTDDYLQHRYPTNGKNTGCSNVDILKPDDNILKQRIERIRNSGNSKIIFGTLATISRTKGQEHVIRAVAELKADGITGIEYHIAGQGKDTERLIGIAESLGVKDQVIMDGHIHHDKVFEWLDRLDVYIQPSFQEGLCRAIVEAMSRALPVTSSNAGGNYEIVAQDMIFKAGNVKQIAERMEKMLDPEVREREAVRSFTRAHDFEKEKLDRKRNEFYSEFTGVRNW